MVNCGTSKEEIIAGLRYCLSDEMQIAAKNYENPYAKLNTAQLIFKELKDVKLTGLNLKTFYDL